MDNLNENSHWNDIGCKGPVIVHGIVGEDCQEPSSPSWFNPNEAFQVMLYIIKLMKSGILAYDIGVITPYASQVYKIFMNLYTMLAYSYNMTFFVLFRSPKSMSY